MTQHPYGYYDAAAPRIRHYAARHADAVAQLPGAGRLRRHHLEHRGRLLVRPRPAQPPRHPLPLQLDPRGPARPLHLPARPGNGRLLEPDLAAGDAGAAGRVRVPARRGLHAHRQRVRGHRGRSLLYFVPPGQPAGRGVRAVGAARAQPLRPSHGVSRPSPTPSSATGTRSRTSRTWTGRSRSCSLRPAPCHRVGGRHLPAHPQLPRALRAVRRVRDRPRGVRRPRPQPGEPAGRRGRQARATAWRPAATTSAACSTSWSLRPGRGAQELDLRPRRDRRAERIPEVVGRYSDPTSGRRGLCRRCRTTGTRYLRRVHRRAARPRDAGDGQRLEPHPVPRQPLLVALRLGLRHRAGPRHGHARLGAGHAGHGPQRAGARQGRAADAVAAPVRGRARVAPGVPAHRARAGRAWRASSRSGRSGSATTTCGW